MHFTDDAALAMHTEEAQQRLKSLCLCVHRLWAHCYLEKTTIIPELKIGEIIQDMVYDYTYLMSTTSPTLGQP
ncbi:hypothetical protein DPMN_036750 [Dreissena polymorpha]|uniref:Uncharacterized protein n=1 Tax=Dreissena polymorpha TaxID=45954 RepID=A0A9D4MBE4_DREPO|nr:hypothetical protein DPMN_036750 [Dreissena polymorpha]